MNNLFITFEGGEGSGKSTQVGLLKDYLDSQSLNTIITREPGGTPSAEILRDLLTRGKVDKWTAMSEALLMWAARYEHIVDVIDPALKAGKNVICDRFYDSTYAYQGIAHNLGIDKMEKLKELIIGDIEPDLTFILDIDPKILKEDKTIIEDLIKAAHNNAKNQLKTKTSEEISKATGGIGIPGFKWPF